MKITPISVSSPLSFAILMAVLVSLCLFHHTSPLRAEEPKSGTPGRSSLSPQEYLANRIRLESGQPAVDTIPELYDELDFQRAVQAYVWATPFVALSEMLDSLERDFGATLTRQPIF